MDAEEIHEGPAETRKSRPRLVADRPAPVCVYPRAIDEDFQDTVLGMLSSIAFCLFLLALGLTLHMWRT